MTQPTPQLNRQQLQALLDQDERQKELLRAAADKIKELSGIPNALAYYLRPGQEDGTVIIFSGGREFRVNEPSDLVMVAGDTVFLNDSMQIVGLESNPRTGDVGYITSVFDDGRLVVLDDMDGTRVLERSQTLGDELIEEGDTVLVDWKAGLVLELLGDEAEKDETKDLLLETVPDVAYSDIGGLKTQLDKIHDAIELPVLFPDIFAKYKAKAPKGVLLYGPPGCGKTMVAKAIARSLGDKCDGGEAFFINIAGPELLNKFVGETERIIREIFTKAKAKASEGHPVVIFFDEIESMFRQRGMGISSDVESTTVPTLLAQMDGVEELNNVIVVGATNRQDLVDPALLRPGRLDVKIEVTRPDSAAAKEIFLKYLTADLPYARADWTGEYAELVTEFMYREETDTEFLEVTYANGNKETLHFKDFASGAMVANIVSRAKLLAVKEELAGGAEGITLQHLKDAVVEEFRETEDLPNTSNPDDWAKISGRKGERIAAVRPLLKKPEDTKADTVASVGQYL